MSSFVVDSDAVLSGAAAVRGTADRVSSDVAALDGQLGSLQGSWSGQAAVAFGAVLEQWRAAQHQLNESLSSIDRALNSAGQQYADVESSNASLFRA